MKKRLIALLLCAAMVLSCCVFGAAAEPMTDAEKQAVLQQRRDIAEAHMRKMVSILWRSDKDVLYTCAASTLPEKASEQFHIVKGRVYLGMPYSFAGGNMGSWSELLSQPDENGVYTVSDLNWQMLSGGSNAARFGTDCSGSVCQAWAQIGSSNDFQVTAAMTRYRGFLHVGEYSASYSKIDDAEITANGAQVMYAAYAQLQKADALVHDGHVRMAVSVNTVYNADNTINGEESTVTFLEQTRSNIRADRNYYDEKLGETVWVVGGVDEVRSFKELFDGAYRPVTCKELVDPDTVVEAPVVTDSLDASAYGYDTLLSGTISTNHWVIDNVEMTITDSLGEVVQKGMVTAYRASSIGANRYTFLMSQFKTEAPCKALGYIAPDALTAGQYHCKVVCRLCTGQEFTIRDFDFAVEQTKNDIHKTVIDFSQGTTQDCPMCGEKAAQWQPLTAAHAGSGNGPAAGHYYLTDSLDTTTYIPVTGVQVCLHLNGHDITGTERALHVGESATLNIMGEGTVTGTYTSTETRGVALDVSNSTVNLYGGTYRHNKGKSQRPIIGLRDSGKVNFYDGAKIVGNPESVRSSVLIYKGRFEMFGGVVEEGYGSNGGNFLIGYTQGYYPSFLLVYGGTIRNGHSSGTNGGGNIYAVYDSHAYIRGGEVYGGEAKLGGNIALHKSANAILTGGTVTGGTASVQGNCIYANNLEDTKLGICLYDAGVRIGGDAEIVGDIEYNGEKNAFLLIESGTSLVKSGLTAARYSTLAEALENYAEYDYLRLHDSQTLALPEGNWKADLNGQRVVLTGEGALEASVDGGATFDALDVHLTHVSLRPENVGIYYTGAWNLGTGLVDKVAASGIAASLATMPAADFADNDSVLYTEQAGATAQNSALIANIFEADATNNLSRGKRLIYAAPYVTFRDGSTVVRGDTPAYSLYDILRYVDNGNDADALQKANAFYSDWASVLSSYNFKNIGK